MTFIDGILSGLSEIGRAFIYDGSMWWVMAPVLCIWLILEVYFGQFKKEKLGWNTALANGISMLWIIVEAMRFIFSDPNIDIFWIRFFVLLLLLGYALFVVYISFEHIFSPKVTYALAAPTPIYFTSVMAVLWSHGHLQFTWWVLLDMIFLFGLVLLFFFLARKLIPESSKDIEEEKPMGDFGGPDETSGKFGSTDSGDLGSDDDFKL